MKLSSLIGISLLGGGGGEEEKKIEAKLSLVDAAEHFVNVFIVFVVNRTPASCQVSDHQYQNIKSGVVKPF